VLILRNEDLDRDRVRSEYVTGMVDDLRWLGIRWTEGPDVGGPFDPYNQSERLAKYAEPLERLRRSGLVFACTCSRKDIAQAIGAPQGGDDEPLYPGTCRARYDPAIIARCAWRFRVPDGEQIQFVDVNLGPQSFVAGRDFGDFTLWRPDGVPAYQLACVVDDHAMGITEVVRGADLLMSTARQLLLYRALGWTPPSFFHCPVVTDERGMRMAKRHDSLSLSVLRNCGQSAERVRADWCVTP